MSPSPPLGISELIGTRLRKINMRYDIPMAGTVSLKNDIPQPPIQGALVQLHDKIGYLREKINYLIERLLPVTPSGAVIYPPPREMSTKAAIQTQSPFTVTVENASADLQDLISQVNALLENIEL